MRIIATRQHFLEKFSIASAFSPNRSSMPVLTHVLIDAQEDGRLCMDATDTENGISVSTVCEVTAPGRVLAPTDRTLAILNESRCDDIEISTHENMLRLVCGPASFDLTTPAPITFPVNRSLANVSDHCTVDADDLHQAIMQTAFAASQESNRFSLGGILFASQADKLNIVATDGRRLATVAITLQSGSLKQDLIPPCKAMQLFAKAKCSGCVNIFADESQIVIENENVRFFARQLEGRFPKWQSVIPSLTEYHACHVQRDAIGRVFRQAAITQDVSTRGVDITFKEGRLIAACTAQDIGSSLTGCDAEYTGPTITTRVDSRFVLDFIKAADIDDIAIAVCNSSAPLLMTANESYRYVVMPMANDKT